MKEIRMKPIYIKTLNKWYYNGAMTDEEPINMKKEFRIAIQFQLLFFLLAFSIAFFIFFNL